MRTTLLILLAWCTACDRSPEGTAAAAQRNAAQPPEVEVVAVESRRLDTQARLPAELVAYESVALYPRVTAFVEQIPVDRGSAVRKGQVLVRLSAPELAAQRAEAQARMLSAQSTYDRTRAAAQTPGAVAKHDLELQDEALKAAKARVDALRTLEGYLTVRAPFDGMVTERDVHPGALVGPPQAPTATPMLRMESIGHLRLVVAVPELDVGAIPDGSTATFSVRTWPGERFTGTIRRVAHTVEARTRTMPVELDVDNRDWRLAPGLFAEVVWPVRRHGDTLFVPVSAVVQTPDRLFVDRVRDGTLEQVAVARGVTTADSVEVFGRLAAGDLVLRRGSEDMRGGSKVTIKAGSGGTASAK